MKTWMVLTGAAATATVAGLLLFATSRPQAVGGPAVSVDTNTSGNTATAVGPVEACSSVSAGPFDVDVVIQGVTSLGTFEADLLYDPGLLQVTGEDAEYILATQVFPPPIVFDLSDSVPDSDGRFQIALTSSGEGGGDGVVIRLTFDALGAGGVSALSLAGVKMWDGNDVVIQPADAQGVYGGPVNGAQVVVNGACTDNDGDGVLDMVDNCPSWPNPAQNLPPWSVPTDDPDCDGFPASTMQMGRAPESYIGTGPNLACGINGWPVDMNDDKVVSLADVLKFGSSPPSPPAFGHLANSAAYQRFDLNQDGLVSLADALLFAPFFGKSCTP
jgi:hypothetical protein